MSNTRVEPHNFESGNESRSSSDGKGSKRTVSVKFLLILIGVIVAVLVGLSIGLYFIGVSAGVASVTTLPQATTSFPGTPSLGYRLPRVAIPSHYKLTLFPNFYFDDESQFKLHGWEIITFNTTVLTYRIFLHARYFQIDFSDVQLYESQNLPDTEEPLPWIGITPSTNKADFALAHYFHHTQFDYYEFVFDKPLPLGEYKLKLHWTGPLVREAHGLYFSKYTRPDRSNAYLVGTQFQPTYTREAFPCFDEPEYKAAFESRLVRADPYQSISNNEIDRTEIVTIDGISYSVDVFHPTVIQSSYLNAFAIHQYYKLEHVDPTKNRVYRFWGRHEWDTSIEYIGSIAPRLLNYLDKYYGTEYPYSKMDFYPIPDYDSGAMENWGLIVYAEWAYYYNPETDPISVKEMVAFITAHEIGHMNFGNIVTTKWWDETWLNEGYATWYEYLGVVEVEPEWDFGDRYLIATVLRAMREDCTNATRPMTQHVQTPNEIYDIFDTISYSRGGSISRMMSGFLTEETYRKGLSVYLYTLQYGNAHRKNLFDTLTAQTVVEDKKIDMSAVMEGWTVQPGYPILTGEFFSKEADSLIIKLTQAPFELDKGKFGSRTWSIPINFLVSNNPNVNPTLHWLHTTEGSITLRDSALTTAWDGWFVLNPDHKGYYRVSYDANNWRKLTEQLFANHSVFSQATRLHLVDDAMNIARGNYASMRYPQALNLITYLCKDTTYSPWSATLTNIDYVEQMLTQTDADSDIKAYGRVLIRTIYHYLGWDANDNGPEPTANHDLRLAVIPRACRWRLDDCTTVAQRHFSQWRQSNGAYILPRDGSSTARCYGIKLGTTDDWWWLYDQYTKTSVPDRRIYTNALGCSDNTTLLRWFLDVSIDNPANTVQEFGNVYAGIAANPTSRNIITEYFYEKWDKIKTMSLSVQKTVLDSTFKYANTAQELQRLQNWKQATGDLGDIEADYNKMIITIGVNIGWMTEHAAEVGSWVNSFHDDTILPVECRETQP